MSISKLQINIFCNLFIFVFCHFAFSAPANELRQLEQLANIQNRNSKISANNSNTKINPNSAQSNNTSGANQNVPATQVETSQFPQENPPKKVEQKRDINSSHRR